MLPIVVEVLGFYEPKKALTIGIILVLIPFSLPVLLVLTLSVYLIGSVVEGIVTSWRDMIKEVKNTEGENK